jgi:hypothetical protein
LANEAVTDDTDGIRGRPHYLPIKSANQILPGLVTVVSIMLKLFGVIIQNVYIRTAMFMNVFFIESRGSLFMYIVFDYTATHIDGTPNGKISEQTTFCPADVVRYTR